jgi:hypothetical protein
MDASSASYRAFSNVAEKQLVPKCRKVDSVSAQPGGSAYYAALVGQHTTTKLTPDQIHQIGLQEVARIRAEMEEVARRAGFASREAMIADMRTNPKWYVTTPEELMEKTAIVTKTIDGKMPGYFGRLARLPYGIRPMTAATAPTDTTARYQLGSPEGGIAGYYLVNTTKLDQRPLWEIPVLSVHEAVPGHHQQIAIQQELDMPQWRKATTFFTAFVEGWGLYSERLGVDMGIYDTPQKDMGRLGYQMWRATRLVVDTGIHSKGWDKARAVAYMKDNTTLTDANIDRVFSGTKQLAIPDTLADMTEVGDIPDEELTVADLLALADMHRDQRDAGATKAYYVLFDSGHFADDTGVQTGVLGVSLGGTGVIAMFKDVIRSTDVPGFPNVVRFVEQSTLIHELAHALGLVDNGVPLASPHRDSDHGAHCDNDRCVMFFANEGAADAAQFVRDVVVSGNTILFDDACLADVDALTGR